MEFCVHKTTGKIIAVREDGAVWGSGESYARFIEQQHEGGRWVDQRLMVIKVPGISDLDQFRYKGGLVDLAWLTANEDPEPVLTEFEWTGIAIIAVEVEAEA